VMISSATERGSEVTFRALELGAVDFVTKPKLGEQTPDDYGAQIAEKIRAAKSARLKVPRKANLEDTVTLPAPIVKRLIAAGAEVDYKNTLGQTALVNALVMSNYEAAEALIGAGAKLSAEGAAKLLENRKDDPKLAELVKKARGGK